MTFQAALLSSDGAHALGTLVEELALRWTADKHACDDVNVVFSVLQNIVARSISKVATQWNSSHDALRVIPAEIQESCFGSLPVPDRCRLSLVCSHWQKNVARSPGIWNCLELTDCQPELDGLLARSGQLPLDLTVHIRRDSMPWDITLRPHANRLRSLVLHHSSGPTEISLGFPTPRLEELTIATANCMTSTVSRVLFEEHAPRLRTLRLTCSTVPSVCPAFAYVTQLTIHYGRGSVSQLFAVMPHLEVLEVRAAGYRVDLPALPPHSSLRTLRLISVYMTVEDLVRLGYSEIDVLEVTTSTPSAGQFLDAIIRWPDLAATITVHPDWEFDVVLRPDRHRLRFAVRPYYYETFQDLFCRSSATFRNVRRLVLPLSFRKSPKAPPSRTLLETDTVIALPALRELAIECGTILPDQKIYPLRDCLAGKLDVPRLSRIEVLRASEAEAPHGTLVEPVDVSYLAALVESTLICDDRRALEVFVDTARGISLNGDVEQLRECVGRLLV